MRVTIGNIGRSRDRDLIPVPDPEGQTTSGSEEEIPVARLDPFIGKAPIVGEPIFWQTLILTSASALSSMLMGIAVRSSNADLTLSPVMRNAAIGIPSSYGWGSYIALRLTLCDSSAM